MTFFVAEQSAAPAPVSEDDVSQFMRDIRQYPLLSPEEERELAQRCAEGDRDAIRQMVNCNLRLVVSIAREYSGRGVHLLDLIQEGSIGLLAAAEKFDPSLEFRFSTYATKWIRRGVLRCLTDQNSLIRIPAHTADKLRKVLMTRNALQQELERIPECCEIAERCGIEAYQVEKLLQLETQIGSLDSPAGDDTTIGMLLKDLQAVQPIEQLIRDELVRIMDELLAQLNERQRMVLRLHFGMEDGICHSLEDISVRFGVSKERIRQIERQAMDILKKKGAAFGVEDFLNE